MSIKRVLVAWALIIASTICFSQKVGKIDWKADGFTQKKFNQVEKKIFLQHFTVNYQTVMVAYAKARGGSAQGGAVAGLALGLDGVSIDQLQRMTDQYYSDFIGKLEAAGFKIMTADEVQETDHFSSWGRIEGGTPMQDTHATGYLTTLPTGFTQLDGGAGVFNLAGQPESNKLGGVIVARVNITVPFAESQSIEGGPVGGVAKITARADLRVSPSESIPRKGDFKKPINLVSNVSFAYKKSLKWQALFNAKMKSAIEIEEVLDESKKYKATSVANSGSGFTAKYNTAYSENAELIECDAAVYETGVNEAVSSYLNGSVETFIGYYK
ncbi:MAG: hypothetical protein R8G66_00070 [Cytophagales bacterium]|nr:hypothetical protein [Cytophagales bacterium]